MTRRETDADGEGHRAVGDTLTEGSLTGKFRVDVVREIVPGVPGMNDYISLGNRAPRGDSLRADYIILEVLGSRHACTLPEESCGRLPPMARESSREALRNASLTSGGPTLSPMRAIKGTVMAAIASPC